ncbi:hypothetical protein [Enterococcus mundtii]|uniref:hypothetical protein n=1 Tax=Enterococcus mundtii TaxID=53346 RepID=UPI001377BCA0|nr:hypothetical protein [Enterococcus mundtii]NBA63082.1 hypothetical protein [Enterococcus mundtii]
MNKYLTFTLLVCSFILGILFKSLNFGEMAHFVNDNDLLGNIVDFMGNILIALTSAGIAWFISNRDKKELSKRKKHESIMALKLLKLEISIHVTKLNNLISNHEDYEKSINEIRNLNIDVWEKNFNKLDVSDDLLEKFHKYYIGLRELGFISEEELNDSQSNYLENQKNKSLKAIEVIEENLKIIT